MEKVIIIDNQYNECYCKSVSFSAAFYEMLVGMRVSESVFPKPIIHSKRGKCGMAKYLIIYLFILLVYMCFFGWIASKVGENKGYRQNEFYWCGFFLGLIGVLIVLSKPDHHRDYYLSYGDR